jgi:ketosteroid isomerase-like protein
VHSHPRERAVGIGAELVAVEVVFPLDGGDAAMLQDVSVDPRSLIERYNDAWNRQDLDTIASMHHPEVVFHNHTAGERAEGADPVREHIGRIFENNPTLRFSTRSLRAGEDFAVCEWTATVTRDGRELEWDGIDVFPLRDGLISRKDVYSASHRPRERSG